MIITLSSLRFIQLVALFALTLIVANSAKAEDSLNPGGQEDYKGQPAESSPASHAPENKGDWKFTLGAGVMYMPAFAGSKEYQVMAFPDIKLEYKDLFFASPFEGIGYNIIDNHGWRAGLLMKFDLGRTEEDDNPFRLAGKKTSALRGLGDVDETEEMPRKSRASWQPGAIV